MSPQWPMYGHVLYCLVTQPLWHPQQCRSYTRVGLLISLGSGFRLRLLTCGISFFFVMDSCFSTISKHDQFVSKSQSSLMQGHLQCVPHPFSCLGWLMKPLVAKLCAFCQPWWLVYISRIGQNRGVWSEVAVIMHRRSGQLVSLTETYHRSLCRWVSCVKNVNGILFEYLIHFRMNHISKFPEHPAYTLPYWSLSYVTKQLKCVSETLLIDDLFLPLQTTIFDAAAFRSVIFTPIFSWCTVLAAAIYIPSSPGDKHWCVLPWGSFCN